MSWVSTEFVVGRSTLSLEKFTVPGIFYRREPQTERPRGMTMIISYFRRVSGWKIPLLAVFCGPGTNGMEEHRPGNRQALLEKLGVYERARPLT